jgi:hypothetical protein
LDWNCILDLYNNISGQTFFIIKPTKKI